MTVDLVARALTCSNGASTAFSIEAQRRERLLGGIDDIAQTLAFEDRIARYETRRGEIAPWVGGIPTDFTTLA